MINWRKVRFRRAAVWCIENAVWIMLLIAALWSLLYVCGGALEILGVA